MPLALIKILILVVYTVVLAFGCKYLITPLWGQILFTAATAAVLATVLGKVGRES
ncbi:hypothetical protein ACH4SP_22140 [Streptomyces sp. NPDC021093]|uniref:hypothetical protein n=1 Tax=Streptomyces sp. NPDC021093 TaxID=3365112 RepID=UPI0037AFDEB6